MNDDEFIERELRGMDVSAETIDHLKALDHEEALHPNEDPYTRSDRLLWEALPAVCGELIDLAATAHSPAVRQEARDFISTLLLGLTDRKQEG